ncbi:MAG: SIS domain-containing protein [Bacteroidaceae bacterium]|nr:SIS domain-containing protein [Bacteroidaceae bacterium]
MNTAYLKNIIDLLEKLESTQEEVIEQVSAVCADCIYNGGLLYFFGTGHSHMVCEEPFYRAGGLACVYPILETDLMLHEGASKSSGYERLEGLGNIVIANTGLGKGDILFIASNSGRNCAVIDAALEAKKRGAITVAITSMNHTTQVSSRHSSGLNLYQVCDYVLDNGGVAGDASVQLPDLSQNIAPTSSVIDLTLVNLIMVNIVERMLEKGMNPPLFMSSNSDGGDKANKSVLEVYRERIPSL